MTRMADGRLRRHRDISHGAESGQSTVEFAIVAAAFIAMLVGLGALWRLGSDGVLAEHAVSSASHALNAAEAGSWGDVLVH